MPENRWLTLLKNHYSAPLELSFRQFKLGAMLFFTGLVIVYLAHQQLPPSVTLEVVTLVGLLLVGVGFLLAMLAQIRMLISRILNFFRS
ncbi:hypothetical protein HBA55_20745 [Pseudomaricurvus alkylphenolicus]|jgi:protein-S-isoprenylcysteine O-methyltransferase Ste14|uniref:hypothetical protein n=1 Tax=Pseudomaricurvus alkylphenolicus TaxID=1306991 RepID=UPI0014200F6F|nr:hypothetical protein [Pseudomaricurvus alkylphenolicus]NIB42046.1 hypothetical protein [Pseudomaricurvus alkylphenolicus]